MENQINHPPRMASGPGATVGHEAGHYRGDPQREILERVRRIETRVTNTLRSLGLQPGRSVRRDPEGSVHHVPSKPPAYDLLLVSDPNVALADISDLAVRMTPAGQDKTFAIVVSNQAWGEITIRSGQ